MHGNTPSSPTRSRQICSRLGARAALAAGLITSLLVVSACSSGNTTKSAEKASARKPAAAPAKSATHDPAPTTTVAAAPAVVRNPGDCLTWQQADGVAPDVQTVPCTSDHLLEVVSDIDASKRFGDLPSVDDIVTLISTDCTPAAEQLLGYKLDASGRFLVDALEPTRAQWDAGSRTVWCALGARATMPRPFKGWRQSFTGAVKGQSQDLLYPVGTCFGLDMSAPTDEDGGGVSGVSEIVPCTDWHGLEVTGTVDISKRTDAYPMPADLAKLVQSDCDQLAVSYVGHALRKGVFGNWFNLPFSSWEVGRRTVQCTVGHYEDQGIVATNKPIRQGG